MIEQQQEARDVLVAAASQGFDWSTDGRRLMKILTDAVVPINQQLQVLLGSSAYDQLMSSEQALPMRSIAHDLQLALSSSVTPLSDDEANRLVHALDEYPPPNPDIVVNVTLNGPLFPIAGIRITDDDIVQAAEVLSDQQLKVLEALQRQKELNSDDASPRIRFSARGFPR